MKEPNQVLIFLLEMIRPTKQDVGPLVVELVGKAAMWRPVEVRKSGTREARPFGEKPSCFEVCLLNSESPSARSHRSAYAPALGGHESTVWPACDSRRQNTLRVMLW